MKNAEKSRKSRKTRKSGKFDVLRPAKISGFLKVKKHLFYQSCIIKPIYFIKMKKPRKKTRFISKSYTKSIFIKSEKSCEKTRKNAHKSLFIFPAS